MTAGEIFAQSGWLSKANSTTANLSSLAGKALAHALTLTHEADGHDNHASHGDTYHDHHGDTHTHDDHLLSHEHFHGHVLVYFLFASLAMGAATMYLLGKYAPWFPYTCMLLVEGFLLGIIHEWTNEGLGSLSVSVEAWSHIDPHVLMYTILPALLFGDSMGLNFHLIRKCLAQCFLLACPGVVLGTFATGYFAMYVFPYGWDLALSMTFGSILAATDPVAVVAILKELGASPGLTMIISGESLMNDGTAIVLFNICKALFLFWEFDNRDGLKEIHVPEEGSVTTWVVAMYLIRMAVGGIIVGSTLGLISVYFIGIASRKTSHSDASIQILVSFCCAYFSFFMGEYLCGVSGVLSTVSAAIVFGTRGWPKFAAPESLHHVWHAIEDIGNTLIFILSGVILGTIVMDDVRSHYLYASDFAYLLLLYLFVVAIRFFMVLLFYPLLRSMGYGLSAKEGVVVSWGGLRGAVGLALAIQVDETLDLVQESGGVMFSEANEKAGSLVLFHVGGIAVLTLLVNGISSGPLLRKLGMVDKSPAKEALLVDIKDRIYKHAINVFNQEVETNREYGFHLTDAYVQSKVLKQCHHLHNMQASHDINVAGATFRTRRPGDDDSSESRRSRRSCQTTFSVCTRGTTMGNLYSQGEEATTAMVRELFLQILRREYTTQVKQGVLPKQNRETAILTGSVDEALDKVSTEGSGDLEKVLSRCNHAKVYRFSCCVLSAIGRVLPATVTRDDYLLQKMVAKHNHSKCYVLTCFIKAHGEAEKKIAFAVGDSEGVDPVERKIIQESQDAVKIVRNELKLMDSELIDTVIAQQIGNVMLEAERRFIAELEEEGMLDGQQAHHLLEEVQEDMNSIKAKGLKAQRKYIMRCASRDSRLVQMPRFAVEDEDGRVSLTARASSNPDGTVDNMSTQKSLSPNPTMRSRPTPTQPTITEAGLGGEVEMNVVL